MVSAKKSIVLWLLFVFTVSMLWAKDKDPLLIKLNSQGKTLSVSNNGDRAENIRIEISIIQGHKYTILYRFYDQVFDPILLKDEKDLKIKNLNDGGSFNIPVEKGKPFFIYNVIDDTTNAIREMINNRHQDEDRLESDQEQLRNQEKSLAEITANLQALKDKIEICRKTTIKEWPRELDQMDSLLEQLYVKKASLEKQWAESSERVGKLKEECGLLKSDLKLIDELVSRTKDLAKNPDEIFFYSIIKAGGIVLGKCQKSVYFDLQDEDDQPLLLNRFGNYPILTQDDLIYAIVMNRIKSKRPGPFYLFVKADNKPVVNPTPVRPVFAALKVEKALRAQDKVYYHADDAYSDVILPFGQKFNGGDVLDLTISTYAEVVTLDKETTGDKPEKTRTTERKLVDLIKEIKLPQVHALYRFNVSPGLILSSLRDHEYFKVKTASDDPLTKEINEARYRTDDVRGEWRAFPTLAFTLYLKRVDIQERMTLGEVLIPNPTVALALNSLDPSKNMFFGFMHEFPVRNTHLFYGLHLGRITELVNRNEVDEDRSDIAPSTRQKTKLGFFVGLSFNLDWLTSIFKK